MPCLRCTFYEKINVPGSFNLKLELEFRKEQKKIENKNKRKRAKSPAGQTMPHSAHFTCLTPARPRSGICARHH